MANTKNTPLDLAIADIHLNAEKPKSHYFCRNFKIYPEDKEINGGYLFGILEIKATPENQSEKIFQTLLTTLKDSYYQQILASPDPQKLNLETIFEFALNQANQRLLELIEIGQVTIIKENIHFFIGIARPVAAQSTNIYFTNQGFVQAFLIHRTKDNEYKIINLIQSTGEPDAQTNRVKIFSAITSGQLAAKDILLVCTEVFSNYISLQKIKHVLLNNPLNHAMAFFKNQIKQANRRDLTFSLLIVKREPQNLTTKQPLAQNSIDNLIITEEKTAQLLTPNFTLNIKQHLRNWRTKLRNAFNVKKSSQALGQKEKSVQLRAQTGHNTKITAADNQSKNNNATPANYNLAGKPRQKFQLNNFKLPKLSQVIIILIILLVIGMVYGISAVKKQSALKAEQTAYAAQLESVKNLINDAEVSLIYRNQNQSLQKLQAAAKELKYLPQATDQQKTNYAELDKQLTGLQNKIYNIEKIVPQLLIDMQIDGQAVAADNIIAAGGKVYAYGNGATLIIIDAASKKIEQIITAPEKLIMAAVNNNELNFISAENNLFILNQNELKPAAIDLASTPGDFKIYNNSLYWLDKDNQQIIKHVNWGAGYGAGQTWISEMGAANLAAAQALAIDGSVYIVQNNGQLLRFHAGQYQPFNNPAIEPAITAAAKIITSAEIDNLYIFEPGAKRLVILNKNGDLLKQLVFDSLEQTVDFTLTADGKTGLILTTNQIYQFEL